MADIYNDITTVLIADSLQNYIELGVLSLLFGFVSCSLVSLLGYGIYKAVSLINIKSE